MNKIAGDMKNDDIYFLIKTYVTKHPNLKYTQIANLILADGATTIALRTLRRKVAEVFAADNQFELNFDASSLTVGVSDSSLKFDFVDSSIKVATIDEKSPDADVIEHAPEQLGIEVTTTVKVSRTPRILVLDIETARMIVGIWNLGWKLTVGPDQMLKDWFIYGWSAKWLGSAITMSDFTTPEEALARTDKRICTSLWDLLEEADAVITHNGIKFDHPKIESRFLENGLGPVSSYATIDTYKAVSKRMGFSSNKLDYLGKTLAGQQKMNTTYSLWIECEQGVPEALTYMETYCKADVNLLEQVYYIVRPWIKGHPNLAVLMNTDKAVCPTCGSDSLTKIDGLYTTQQGAYTMVRCNTCGAVNRTKTSVISPELRKNMIVPAAH